MAYADFDEMKKEFPARNFDNVDITEDFNIAGQNGAGVYGAFKFFHGIRSFFKGISALGKLASGSRILVSDDKGNISYTTPSEITEGFATNESVNNALTNYQKVKRITLNTAQTLTLTHNTSPFAVKITIQGTKGFTDYFCIQYQGYGVGTYDHIFELLKGTSSAYTKEGNTLSFTVSAKTWVTIEYLIGDETTITDTIS